MGRTGSWFSAIKKVFTPNSKDKLSNEKEKKSSHEKKVRGRSKYGESRSFIPLFREPSSIEKILGEVDQQMLFMGHPTPVEQPTTPQPLFSGRPASPRVSPHRTASPRAVSPKSSPRRAVSPKSSPRRVVSPKGSPRRAVSPKSSPLRAVSPKSSPPRVVQRRTEICDRPEPTLRNQHLSATRIQASYRGYMTRKSFRARRGLVRLQGVVKGQNAKRQTANAMKQMQLLVRVQTQIQSRRIQMLENQALERQTHENDKDVESSLGKWTSNNLSETGDENWDDSVVTKEEREARLRRKMEAMIKRERAMAYAYSHQLWKATPKSAQTALTDIRSGGYPWWWNWLERQLPSNEPHTKRPEFTPTPLRSYLDHKPSPTPESSIFKQTGFSLENLDTPTPKSSKSTFPTRARPLMTPTRTPPSTTPNLMKYSRSKGGAVGSSYPIKDDDSLMSCPPFSVPNYMSPTVSAKAKARLTGNNKDQLTSTAASETSSRRRFSFPLSQTIGSSFKWRKGSPSKDSTTSQAPRVLEKHKSPRSIGDLSMDSSMSMPAAFGRKPFNRFV